ncbi:MAG: pilus assembly protein PilM [Patescibacteria group bacterium]
MFKNSYDKFFPTPDFLKMPSFGLDISDESLKFIELVATKDGIKIGKYGEKKIPSGIVESGKIIDPKKMEEILLVLKKEQKIKSVRVSLLENQIYLFSVSLEKEGLTSVREAIELSLEEHIPIPAPEAIFDYEILSETDTMLELQVAAIPENVIDSYLTVFKDCNLTVHSFELEPQAITRAIIKKGDVETYMIVDFGETRTGIFIVSRGIVMFTSTLEIGGSSLNNMIQKSFNVSFEEADKMKKEYGLQRNTVNRELFSVLLNSVSILRDEIVKHQLYWNTHKDEDGKSSPQIKKVLLCGGDSNLIGLAEYLSVSMKTTVEMANVWSNIADTKYYVPEMSFKQALSFAAALGLALGDFEDD